MSPACNDFHEAVVGAGGQFFLRLVSFEDGDRTVGFSEVNVDFLVHVDECQVLVGDSHLSFLEDAAVVPAFDRRCL